MHNGEYDKGTPQTQAKLGKDLDRTGLDYLFQQKTLNTQQLVAGRCYGHFFKNAHQQNNPKSSLGNLVVSEGASDPVSDYWTKLTSIHDAQTWKKHIDDRLRDKSFRNRRPYHQIIMHIAGLEDWAVRHVREFCASNHVYGTIGQDTASKWVREAFDVLDKIITDIVDSHERCQRTSCDDRSEIVC